MTSQPSLYEHSNSRVRTTRWSPVQVCGTALLCLLLGLFVGYLVRGSASATSPLPPAASRVLPEPGKRLADKEVEPLLARLQAEPNNHDLLLQIAKIYSVAHRTDETVRYLKAALNVQPDDVETRIQLGNLYFYSGKTREAIAEFQTVLESDPANANALFNIGMVKWRAYNDVNGAVISWRTLLARNPNHPKRRDVEGLIAQAQQHAKRKPSRDLTN